MDTAYDDFEICVMIFVLKKNKSDKCGEHRTISLISYASKILIIRPGSLWDWVLVRIYIVVQRLYYGDSRQL